MENKCSKIFIDIELPKHLKRNVLLSIEKEHQKRDMQRKMLFWSLFSVAVILFIGALLFFGHEILASEFWSLASLGLTDMQFVAAYWQDYSFSLMETFPIMATLSILFPIFIMLFAVKKYEDSESLESGYKLSYKN